MTKKIFSVIVAFAILLFTSCAFAADNSVGGMINDAGSHIKNAVEDTGNAVKGGVESIGNGIKDVGNSAVSGLNDATQTRNNNRTTGSMTNGNNNGRYSATRTATNGTFMGMNGTTWTWFILGITALAIVGLVWYYAMQNNSEYDHSHNNH